MESRIFECIDDDDVEELKSLMHYPNLFQIEDDDSLTVLQRAISNESFAVFNFLLSLDDCPINARNSKGETAIQFALYFCGRGWIDNFIYPLLKKGADVDWKKNRESPALRLALYDDRLDIVQCLIEKGWDLNYQDLSTGQTPLHMIVELYRNLDEYVAMMLYFGADPLIPNFEGFTPIDFAFKEHFLSESMLEHLIFYTFDDYYSGYDIPIDSLFGLLKIKLPLFPQMLKHITSVNVNVEGEWHLYFQQIFIMKPKYLKLLLEKFDYVIEAILDASLEYNIPRIMLLEKISIENCDLLLQSQFSSDVIQIINQISISNIISQSEYANKPHGEIFDLIFFLLSSGANICDYDLEKIYGRFGDCEFFRMLLHMDIKINVLRQYENDIMPGLLYNIHMDIETFLSDPKRYKCSPEALRQLLYRFAHPKLKIFYWRWPIQSDNIHAKLEELPTVPLLVDLARNKVRRFLIQKYKIKNSMQFYTLIKHLPIIKVYQKIITLETKLY